MFYIDTSHKSIEGLCPCCNSYHPVYKSRDEMAWDCMALTLNRISMEENGHETFQKTSLITSKTNAVDFLEMELAAALALAEDALDLAPEIEAIIGPTLREALNADEVYEAIGRADRTWRNNSFKKGTAAKWEEAITLSIATGIVNVDRNIFVDRFFRTPIIEGMVRAGKYYTNEFFNTQVMPALITSVEQAISGNAVGGRVGYRIIQEVMSQRLRSVPYWNVVANAAASRSFHYGMLKAGSLSGRTRFRFSAVLDFKTSDICQSMNGREWEIDRGLSLVERIARLEDPDEVKNIAPWVKAEDIENATDADLADMGVMVPPLHGRCRSTIDLL